MTSMAKKVVSEEEHVLIKDYKSKPFLFGTICTDDLATVRPES